MSTGKSNTMKFGVMIPKNHIELWQKKCINKMTNVDSVSLKLVIIDERERMLRDKLRSIRPRQIFFQIYKNVFLKYEHGKKVSIDSVINNADKIKIKNVSVDGYSEYFPNGKIREIEEHNLDFILRFAFGIIRGDILESAKYGVWSFHHDDEREYRGGPPGFWEVYNGDENTGFILQRLTERLDGGFVLKRGRVSTNLKSYSSNLNRVLQASTDLPVEVCENILSSGCQSIGSKSSSDAPIYSYPTNTQFLMFVLKVIWRRLRGCF